MEELWAKRSSHSLHVRIPKLDVGSLALYQVSMISRQDTVTTGLESAAPLPPNHHDQAGISWSSPHLVPSSPSLAFRLCFLCHFLHGN